MINAPLQETVRPLIAVVDDDASLLRSVARLLRSDGYEVVTFGGTQELIAALPGLKPRCLVLDVHMPEMSGLELQELLAIRGRCPPTIFMTAHDTPQTRDRALQAGSFGLLVKPFDKMELLNAISEALRLSLPVKKVIKA
ncbi:MAG TPA: response regulator [Candidatus Limnocylindrales bacterium]|nr:response regulator [Candidatus Limnocylindrales bacterium]